jgi:large repetitive protein
MAAAPSYAAITAPTPTIPTNGSSQDQAPVFGWTPVKGAATYNFELATDPGFNSVVYRLTGTKNTRATDPNALADDAYYWHVRAVNSTGTASPWSDTMQFTKSWTDAPVQVSPADGSTVAFPTPLILNWDKTPFAASYHLIVASDPQLTSIVLNLGAPGSSGTAPNGTQFAPSQLAPNTYYWEVWPVDAAGHEGQGSGVWSFTWQDPDAMSNLQVNDQVADPQVFDGLFSWDPVPGAKGYQIDINPAADFSTGSSICCGTNVIYATSYAPTTVLENNTLYWRVRPVFVDGTAGGWTEGPQYTQAYDTQDPSIPNLRMIAPDGSDLGGLGTDTPIVAWDPVPGASYYEVNITPFTGGQCDWGLQVFNSKTASTYWTPLGNGLVASKPYPSSVNVSTDSIGLTAGQDYCVRVRAYRDRAAGNVPVFGAYTYLNGGAAASFTFSGYPTNGGTCSPSCNAGYLGDSDSLLPDEGSTTPRAPLFTWNPIAGKQSYFFILAKDPQFTNIVDYAFTKVPAYAPRTGSGAKTYTDESTSYYWAVLPATNANGTGAVGNPLLAAFHDFIKASVPPTQDLPADTDTVPGAVQFQWELAEGARKYHIQVDDQNTFSSPLIDTTTDSTTFVSPIGLPQGTLYWRVQAQDENGISLNWSPMESFTHTLDAPTVSSGPGINPASGPDVPAWQWDPVDGAAKYEIEVKWEKTVGTLTTQSWQTTADAWSASSMTGVGQFQWRVHAMFPASGSSTVDGNDSPWQSFNRTIPGPTGLASDLATTSTGATKVLTTWNPSLGAKSYKVEFSATNSFASPFDSSTVQNAAYAPTMSSFGSTAYANGGTIYWRVATVDDDNNVGSYTVSTLTLPTKTVLTSSSSSIHKGVTTSVTFTLKTVGGTGVVGASVHVSGAGVIAATKSTGTGGKVTFKLKPTKTGKVAVTASKVGYYKTAYTLTAY